jgi:purine-binding chemotaxis protein CheW
MQMFSPTDDVERLLLIVRIGSQLFALPARAVERILPMAAPIPLPEAPNGVVGLLNIQGTVVPVLDPRPALGQITPPIHPAQHLVLVSCQNRYLLWVDRVEQILEADARHDDPAPVGGNRRLVALIAQIAGETIPVLSPEALDPGALLPPASASIR